MDDIRFSRCLGVRGLHGSVKQSTDYWRSRAAALGEAAGRWAHRALEQRGAEAIRSIMGLCHLADKRRAADIDAACAKAMDAAAGLPAFRAIKQMLEAGGGASEQIQMVLREVDPIIRPLTDYADFIRGKDPAGDFFHPETTMLSEPQTTSKAS